MLEELERTLRQAGELALTESLNVTAKGKSDFVTSTDLAVDRCLRGALPRLAPGSRVFSEEEADGGDLSGRVFIVDPIDGTTNLMYHMQLSAISCGYAEDGRLMAAGVYNPFTREMFLAERGRGATLNGRPIHVNADETLEEAVLGVEAGPATIGEGQRGYFERVFALHMRGRGMRKIVELNVAGAFHSRLMREAGEALREALEQAEIRMPQVPLPRWLQPGTR